MRDRERVGVQVWLREVRAPAEMAKDLEESDIFFNAANSLASLTSRGYYVTFDRDESGAVLCRVYPPVSSRGYRPDGYAVQVTADSIREAIARVEKAVFIANNDSSILQLSPRPVEVSIYAPSR